jgi:DNA-binding NtrC family response regulator
MISIDYSDVSKIPTRDEVLKAHILATLRACGMNRRVAADQLDMSYRWLTKKLHDWNVGAEYFHRRGRPQRKHGCPIPSVG